MNRVQIIAGAALLVAIAGGSAAIAQDAPAASAAATCQVTVDRSQAADSFRVDKQALESGECVCYVYTGPTTQGAETEAKVADVQSRRDCGAAPLPEVASAGGGSNVPYYIGGAAGISLIAVLAGGGGSGDDSTGG